MEENNTTTTTTTSTTSGKGLGIAGLVLGILSLILSFVPCIGMYAILPGLVALVLSIVSMIQAKKGGASNGLAIGGLICSIIAIAIAIWWIFAVSKVADSGSKTLEILNEMEKNTKINSDSLTKVMESLRQLNDTTTGH